MKSKRKRGFLLILSLLMIMATGRGADAMRFEGGGGTTIDCDVTLSYGASFRAKEPDRDKLGKYNPAARNSDDGNENFDQWDMINNRFSIIADLEIKRGNYGVFIRPRAFYDFVYMGHNANDSPATNNNYQAGSINDVHDFDKEVERALGKSADILDLFAYGKWKLPGERNLDLRVGRQVIQWGESLYIQGGIAGAQAHQDANLSAAPGVEIKEKLLPSEAVYAQVDITENVSFATYYQWKWEKSLYYESGSFFATSDMLDEAGHVILGSSGIAYTRGQDDHPSDSGQFGVQLMYLAGWLNNTELGAYFINYHEKAPMVLYGPDRTYYLAYADNVRLWGASFGTQIGDANVSGEISYRLDYPVQVSGGYEFADVLQAQISSIYYYGSTFYCDQVAMQGEVGFVRALGVDEDRLSKDRHAWGFQIGITPKWYQVISGLDVDLPLSFACNVDGRAVNAAFTEKADKGSIGLKFTYKNSYVFNIKYVDFFNSSRNARSDRDYLAMDISYSF